MTHDEKMAIMDMMKSGDYDTIIQAWTLYTTVEAERIAYTQEWINTIPELPRYYQRWAGSSRGSQNPRQGHADYPQGRS